MRTCLVFPRTTSHAPVLIWLRVYSLLSAITLLLLNTPTPGQSSLSPCRNSVNILEGKKVQMHVSFVALPPPSITYLFLIKPEGNKIIGIIMEDEIPSCLCLA